MASAARGALGISSETCAEYGIAWRTAISIPPAETFSAVANSRNSFSASSARLLTKTGMARGSRGHRRRSPPGVLPFADPSFLNPHLSFPITQHFKHLGGQKTHFPGKYTKEPGINTYTELATLGVRSHKAHEGVAFPASSRAVLFHGAGALPAFGWAKSASFCHTWVISLHFSLTRKSNASYDAVKAFFLTSGVHSPLS